MRLYDLLFANLAYTPDTKLEIYDYEVPRMIAFDTMTKLVEEDLADCTVKFFNGTRIYIILK